MDDADWDDPAGPRRRFGGREDVLAVESGCEDELFQGRERFPGGMAVRWKSEWVVCLCVSCRLEIGVVMTGRGGSRAADQYL